jgi:dihydrofolate reductase
VFGGPWSYAEGPQGKPAGVDKELLDSSLAQVGAVIGGRRTYESAGAWGGSNPFGAPFFILTHHPEDAPAPEQGFTFVSGLETALAQAQEAAGDKSVSIMGGANVIRQALRAGVVDDLTISVAPVILGGGKRLFDGLEADIELEPGEVLQSPWVTHLQYRVRH